MLFRNNNFSPQRGFTLFELLVVMIIILVFVGTAFLSFNYKRTPKEESEKIKNFIKFTCDYALITQNAHIFAITEENGKKFLSAKYINQKFLYKELYGSAKNLEASVEINTLDEEKAWLPVKQIKNIEFPTQKVYFKITRLSEQNNLHQLLNDNEWVCWPNGMVDSGEIEVEFEDTNLEIIWNTSLEFEDEQEQE